jgi:hypothetical protein
MISQSTRHFVPEDLNFHCCKAVMSLCISHFKAVCEIQEFFCVQFCAALDKVMRGWNNYIMVESLIKNILTALRAVTELQNPAIRERHWQQLMAATKVRHLTLSNSSYNS